MQTILNINTLVALRRVNVAILETVFLNLQAAKNDVDKGNLFNKVSIYSVFTSSNNSSNTDYGYMSSNSKVDFTV